jgi:hypothetical protein
MHLRRALLILFFAPVFGGTLVAQTFQNDRYTLTLNGDASITVAVAGVATPHELAPEFAVMFSAAAPGFNENHDNYYLAPRTSILWTAYEIPADELNTTLNTPEWRTQLAYPVRVEGSGTARTWTYYTNDTLSEVKLAISGIYARGTIDPFRVGVRHALRAARASLATTAEGTTVTWTFTDDTARPFTFSASLLLPSGDETPRIETRIVARTGGYYMAAFTGVPGVASADYVVGPQDALGGNNKHFNHVVCEGQLMLPRAQVTSKAGWSAAVVVDPSESYFTDAAGDARAPTRANSRFGVMLQRQDGQIRPLAFAPLLGGAESQLAAGAEHRFRVRYVVQPGGWKEIYRHVAESVFHLDDPRDNTGTGSLNRTFERVMDYLADRNGRNYAMWHAEQKYYDYFSDQPNSFKPFSPLFGLAAAVITDDEDFYWRRVLPQVEFGLSRASNTFVPYDTEDTGLLSNPSRSLGSPYLSSVQLASLHAFYQQRVDALRTLATEKNFSTSVFAQLLAKYALTGAPADLTAALNRANARLVSDPTGFSDHYMDWLDIWEASGATPAQRDPRYLAAALNGAYEWAARTAVLSPAVPATQITVDRGGRAPVHAHSLGRWPRWGFPAPLGYPTPEQTVPAWRVALTGLASEAYRGEFWLDNHGHLMRLSHLAGGDTFLRSVSRWAMVGRFANYPGDNRSVPSLVIERPELPDQPMWLLSHATMNPGHAWEFAGEILDFLVSNFYAQSGGAIDFPARSMHGGAFRVRLYGDRPGRFYGDEGVRLWLPRGLATPDNPQVDYLAGYGNGRLYLAFINQAATPQTVSVALDPARVGAWSGMGGRRWVNNDAAESVGFSGNTLPAFTIPARGLVAFALDGVTPRTALQRRMLDVAAPKLGAAALSRQTFAVGGTTAKVNGMLLSLGRGLTSAFVYTDLLAERVISARLRYRQGGDAAWQERTDEIFPFEFSIPVAEGRGAFEAYLELTVPDAELGSVVVTAPVLTLATENAYAGFAAGNGLAASPQGGPLADADGDGVSNLHEFFLGSEATAADRVRWPELQLAADGEPVFAFTRRTTAAGVAFDVQLSQDLVTWVDLAGSEDENLFEIVAETGSLERLSLRLLPELDRFFLRLRVVNE